MNKRLYRSSKNTVIGGVCGGIAEYLNTDPTLIRLIWVISALYIGVGVMAYIICLIVIPERKTDSFTHRKENEHTGEEIIVSAKMENSDLKEEEYCQESPDSNQNSRFLAGTLLICLGGLMLAKKWFYWIDFSKYWPVLLIIAGLMIIVRATGRKEESQ